MAIAALLPATLRNVLSALWRAQRRTWKATYFSLCPAAWQKSAWSYKKNASWLTVSYSNSLWAFARFIFSVYFHVLPHFSSSPWIHSQLLPAARLPEVLPNEVTFSGLFFSFVFLASFYLCAAAPPPALQASHWQTAVDHKMVDQSLFPAHPNWRLLGEQLGYRSDPTFY